MKQGKHLFLLSFLPAIAYWWLEENYPLRIALGVGLGLAVIEILIEKWLLGHIHTISKVNFFLILFLGGLSMLGEDGIWFKLQPTFTGIGISSFLFYQIFRGKSLLLEMQKDIPSKVEMPREIGFLVEKHLAVFMFLYGLFMAYVAVKMNTDQWLFFKTAGFYIAAGIFSLFEIIVIRRWIKNQMAASSAAK